MEQKGTLKYRKLQRTPQSGENAGKKKWYATAVTDREVDFEGFVSHISDHGSPYSRGTIHGVLMDALDHLQELILDGVMGDERTYERAVALRAVLSTDGMTADWAHLPYEFLAKVSNDIINKVRGVNRVVYDISSKPPSTIEWE